PPVDLSNALTTLQHLYPFVHWHPPLTTDTLLGQQFPMALLYLFFLPKQVAPLYYFARGWPQDIVIIGSDSTGSNTLPANKSRNTGVVSWSVQWPICNWHCRYISTI